MSKRSARFVLFGVKSAMIVCGMGIAGCHQDPPPLPPPPNTVNDTTSERGMPEPVALQQLNPAIDKAADYLIANLPNLDVVKNSPNQLVLALPPTFEHDATIPDGRLQSALKSLRSKLADNEKFKQNFVVISSTELEANSTLNQIQTDNSGFRDPLQRTADKTHAEKYDPTSIYLLSGKFYQLTDPAAGQREYKLFFHVDNAQSRQEILHKEIDIRLKWDGAQWQEDLNELTGRRRDDSSEDSI